MGMTATDWGWKRSNLRTNKGICPPWLQDNEYRRDLTPNNPGYHHTMDHMLAEYDVFILLTQIVTTL